MARGQDGSLRLSCMTLTFTAPRRFIPTLSTPRRVLPAHLADEVANVQRNCRTTDVSLPDLPGPEKAKSLAMPGDRGRGSNVVGLTMSSAERQSPQTRERKTQN